MHIPIPALPNPSDARVFLTFQSPKHASDDIGLVETIVVGKEQKGLVAFLPTILIAYGTSIIILLEALLVREGDPNVMLRFEMHDALVAEAFDN